MKYTKELMNAIANMSFMSIKRNSELNAFALAKIRVCYGMEAILPDEGYEHCQFMNALMHHYPQFYNMNEWVSMFIEDCRCFKYLA